MRRDQELLSGGRQERGSVLVLGRAAGVVAEFAAVPGPTVMHDDASGRVGHSEKVEGWSMAAWVRRCRRRPTGMCKSTVRSQAP